MARTKGDLMRAHGKRSHRRKLFSNLGGLHLTLEEFEREILLQLPRIRQFMHNGIYVREIQRWLKDIGRLLDNY